MDPAAVATALYDDIEVPVFFESSDDEDSNQVQPQQASHVASVADDLRKLEAAMREHQPFRLSSARGLRRLVTAEHPTDEWKRLCDGEALDERVSRAIEDVTRPALVPGLVDDWPARRKWSSAEELQNHYADLGLVLMRLEAPGGMGKSMPVQVTLAAYLEYCRTTDSDYPLYCFDHSLPSTVLRHDYR